MEPVLSFIIIGRYKSRQKNRYMDCHQQPDSPGKIEADPLAALG
jgi:hypothetical protein